MEEIINEGCANVFTPLHTLSNYNYKFQCILLRFRVINQRFVDNCECHYCDMNEGIHVTVMNMNACTLL